MRCLVWDQFSVAAATLLLLALSALNPQPVGAQSWSTQEQEAIDHLKACWSTWATEDYEAWARACNLDPSGSYWNTAELAPNSMETADGYLRDIVLEGFEDTDVEAWDVRPIRVMSWGEVVGVHFYGILHLRGSDGTISIVQDRRFEVVRPRRRRVGH